MEPALYVPLGLVLLVLVWFLANYNRFVRLRNHLKESWSDIDVELKRRHELIPNLVATVKGYAAHEKEVFERVSALRARAMAPHTDAAERARDESELLLGLKSVFIVAENYPQLKSDAQFLALQKELALTEDRIAAARRFYNGNVRDMRSLCEQLPTSLIASMFGFSSGAFFELGSAAERVVPRVALEP